MSAGTAGMRRYRSFDAPALLGLRRLFLGTGVREATIVFWLVAVRGVASIATAFGSGTWHGHEMIFGFAAASGAGFFCLGRFLVGRSQCRCTAYSWPSRLGPGLIALPRRPLSHRRG